MKRKRKRIEEKGKMKRAEQPSTQRMFSHRLLDVYVCAEEDPSMQPNTNYTENRFRFGDIVIFVLAFGSTHFSLDSKCDFRK